MVIFATFAKNYNTKCHMTKLDQKEAYYQLAYLVLPECMVDSYDIVNIELTSLPNPDPLMRGYLQIYLEEKDLRSDTQKSELMPNGFTEGRWFDDFPIRDRKVSICVKRRRYIDAKGHNIVLNHEEIVAKGTSYSVEFGAFLKSVYGELPSWGPHSGALLRD